MEWMHLDENEAYPYYRFTFEGFSNQQLHFRSQRAKNGERQGFTSNLRAWFHEMTHQQWQNSPRWIRFDRAVLVIFHHFDAKQATDLDNYAYKIVIDAIKSTNIMSNDDFEHLSLCIKGLQSDRAMLDCFVIPEGYEAHFLAHNRFYPITFSAFTEVSARQLEQEKIQLAKEQQWF